MVFQKAPQRLSSIFVSSNSGQRLREQKLDVRRRSMRPVERLLRFLTLLDRDVEIVIKPKSKGRAPGLVSVSVV